MLVERGEKSPRCVCIKRVLSIAIGMHGGCNPPL